MSVASGQRFFIPLDSDTDGLPEEAGIPFVGDIKERDVSQAPEATAPTIKSSTSGFPSHRKRNVRSRFKEKRSAQQSAGDTLTQRTGNGTSQMQDGTGLTMSDRERIDLENRRRIEDMSPDEIARERQELFSGLSPSFIERLLKRANIDEPADSQQGAVETMHTPHEEESIEGANGKPYDSRGLTAPGSAATEDADHGAENGESKLRKKVTFQVEVTDATPEPPLLATESDSRLSRERESSEPRIHFPAPKQPTSLDPSSPNFYSELHEMYFPQLEHDPAKLDWLSPVPNSGSEEDKSSPYHPSRSDIAPAEIRFGFTGVLLPPRLARQLPTDVGLHHHSDAPEAAGYTIPELARLSRSQVPSQRCIAYQTLGRILYRLGTGEFGNEHAKAPGDDDDYEDAGAQLARGLWNCVEQCRILETLGEEANRDAGHQTAKAYATQALWNWRRGGGRTKKAI